MRKTYSNRTKWLSFGSFVHSPGVIKKHDRKIGGLLRAKETASGKRLDIVENS